LLRPHGRRRGGRAALALAALAAACTPHATTPGHPAHGVLLITMHEDRLRPSASEPKRTTTQIFTISTGGRITLFYSLVRDSATDRVLEETRWSRARPSVFEDRDWRRCHAESGRPPDPQMSTTGALLTDILGPEKPTSDARVLSPGVWEIDRGLMRLRIRQRGSGWFDRTVLVGSARHFQTRIHNVSKAYIGAFPNWCRGWPCVTG
jgi:hypothetical protein